jgi:hypothetical protein
MTDSPTAIVAPAAPAPEAVHRRRPEDHREGGRRGRRVLADRAGRARRHAVAAGPRRGVVRAVARRDGAAGLGAGQVLDRRAGVVVRPGPAGRCLGARRRRGGERAGAALPEKSASVGALCFLEGAE